MPPSQGGDGVKHPPQTTNLGEIKITFIGRKTFYETSTSTSEAMLSPPLEDRPLVEEREEFFALSREEEKAV